VDGPDDRLTLPIVADSSAGGLDPRGESGLADEARSPDLVEELLLRDHPIVVPDQMGEHLEHLRFHRHRLVVAAELVAAEVELQTCEPEDHVAAPVPPSGSW
jgi:hypothetical protein